MILGDSVTIGGGGASASIFASGALTSADSCVATKGGRTYNGVWSTIPIPNPAWKGLPSGFTQVEYITSSGTQYINTHIHVSTTSDIAWRSVFMITTGASAWTDRCPAGARAENFSQFKFPNCYGGQYEVNPMAIATGTVQSNTKLDMLFEYRKSSGSSYIDKGTLTLNDTVLLDNVTLYNTMDGSPSPDIYLGAMNQSDVAQWYMIGNMYEYEYISDGVQVADFIPCLNTSTNKYGMYDIVSQTFFGNSGTGNFTGGNEVPQYIGTTSGFLISNLKEYGTYTVTATHSGQTKNIDFYIDSAIMFELSFIFPVHPEMAWSGTGKWVTINNRGYYKQNSGEAICGATYKGVNGSYVTCPLLVSTNAEYVTYTADSGGPFTYLTTITYNDILYYVSASEHAWGGKLTATFTNVSSIRTDIGNYSTDILAMQASAKALLDYYYTGSY